MGLLKPGTATRWRESLIAREADERGEYILQLALESVLKLKQAKAKMVFLSTFHKGHFISLLLGAGPKEYFTV